MLLGQILFILAAVSIVGATAIGIVAGVTKIVHHKVLGRDLSRRPRVGSHEWMRDESRSSVDVVRKSLLTERHRSTADDPLVNLAGDRYRVTRLASSRFLITHVEEGRRLGTFELAGNGRHQDVVPEPDDPSNAKLLVQIAVLSSLARREDGRSIDSPS